MKFRLKMTLCMLGLLSMLFGVGGSLLISLSFQSALEREQKAAYETYLSVLGTLQIVNDINGISDYGNIARTLEQLSQQNAGAWTALHLYKDDRNIYEYNVSGIADFQEISESGSCVLRYIPEGETGHSITLSGSLETAGEKLYLNMAWDVAPLFEARQAQHLTYQRVFLFMAFLCALLSYSIAGVLTAPLACMSEASRSIAAGRLSARVPIRSNDEIGLAARDFNTMAQALEDNISQLKEAAERQERFMGSFAHEVKTPMTSIIGYADLLRGQTLNAEEAVEAANYIVAEGKRLENLAQKLLNIMVVRHGKPDFAPVKPASLIQNLAANLEPLYGRQGITLSCDCEDGACLLEPDLFKSLLINLWDNARKSMNGQGGHIEVRSEMMEDGCRIVIRDNGQGIPPVALKHLTEAFYRVDKARAREMGGAGLGLALCREIVSIHGGSLRFDSEVSQGTTVTIELKGGGA